MNVESTKCCTRLLLTKDQERYSFEKKLGLLTLTKSSKTLNFKNSKGGIH